MNELERYYGKMDVKLDVVLKILDVKSGKSKKSGIEGRAPSVFFTLQMVQVGGIPTNATGDKNFLGSVGGVKHSKTVFDQTHPIMFNTLNDVSKGAEGLGALVNKTIGVNLVTIDTNKAFYGQFRNENGELERQVPERVLNRMQFVLFTDEDPTVELRRRIKTTDWVPDTQTTPDTESASV
jgi:hypothetical protein